LSDTDFITTMLRIVRWFAKAAPRVAPFVEKIADALLAADANLKGDLRTEAIVARAFEGSGESSQASAVRGAASLQSTSMPRTNGIEASRLPSAPPVEVSDHHSTVSAKIEKVSHVDDVRGTASSGATTDPQELVLRQIENNFLEAAKRGERAADQLHVQDQAAFRLSITFAVISLAFIVGGAYLISVHRLNLLGALAELLGLISGSGSAILRSLQKELVAKAERLEKQASEQNHYLRAIQTSLVMTPGPEREAQLAHTSKWIREQGTRPA
jgi:hypothetical protein